MALPPPPPAARAVQRGSLASNHAFAVTLEDLHTQTATQLTAAVHHFLRRGSVKACSHDQRLTARRAGRHDRSLGHETLATKPGAQPGCGRAIGTHCRSKRHRLAAAQVPPDVHTAWHSKIWLQIACALRAAGKGGTRAAIGVAALAMVVHPDQLDAHDEAGLAHLERLAAVAPVALHLTAIPIQSDMAVPAVRRHFAHNIAVRKGQPLPGAAAGQPCRLGAVCCPAPIAGWAV